MKCYLTCSNRLVVKSMKYQPMVLTIPFVLNKRFRLSHQEQDQLFRKEIIRII
ncbi:hypothetical protein [Candidatus Enterovibrio altilux]|uniref:hypothetical protein n=1 Tax=Candidatus Enterovibrio altilux TaxID=1927128 RepID=UPI00168174B9|nr:hypothetical protein [Candidatus Enterovibrio luxaltus]